MPHGLGVPRSSEDERERSSGVTARTRQGSGLLWGVGAVAIRLGIATPTLRTWERRYGIGPSSRTEGGHRRYSEHDIERVRLMQLLVGEGVPAQSAAGVAVSLDATELSAALSAPVPHGTGRRTPRRPTSAPPVAVTSILRAARDLDERTLSEVYAQVLEDWGVVEAWTDVFVPALRVIGERWCDGSLGVESEHLATYRLTSELRRLTSTHAPAAGDRRPILLGGAGDDLHGLPLVALEASLTARGVVSHCLGARVPGPAIGAAVARLDPVAVFVWASLDRDPEDATLAMLGAVDVPVLVGGPGWPDGGLGRVDRCDDLATAVDRLCALVDGPPAAGSTGPDGT